MPKLVRGEVIENIRLTPTTNILRVRAPEIARHASPGQFVHVRCADRWDPLLRRPISVMKLPDGVLSSRSAGAFSENAAWRRTHTLSTVVERVRACPERSEGVRTPGPRADKGSLGFSSLVGGQQTMTNSDEFALLIEVIGRGSEILAASKAGDYLDLLGPLGRGFALHPRARRVVLVAGGAGIAPLLSLAGEALRRGTEVTLLFGAKTVAKVFPSDLLPPEVEYIVHTDDGTMGQTGFVTESVPALLSWADQLFACGPMPMLRALAKVTKEAEHFESRARGRAWSDKNPSPPWAQVSLEQHMGCGMGACYGCAIETNAGLERVCRDGPVFGLSEVSWW